MTPPIRRRSLAEIAEASFAQQEQPDPYKPTTPRIATDSPRVTQVSAPKGYAGDYVGGVVRQAAQGATFGWADEAEAGLRSGFGPRAYRDVRDEIRGKNDKFVSENPGTALAANLVGGVASGAGLAGAAKALPRIGAGMRTLGLAPRAEATMTAAQRIGNGMKMGTAAGIAAGAGAAKERADVPVGMLAGGVAGGMAGGVFGLAAEGMRGARNLVSRVGQGQSAPGALRRAIRADSPDQAAAKRTLALLGQQNMSVDDLATRSAAADTPDILGEVIGQRGIRTTSSANRLGYEAPDFIEDGLTRRGRDEVDRVRTAWRDAAGDPVDDVAFAEAKLREAQTNAKTLYDQAIDGVKITDPRVPSLMERPAGAAGYDNVVRNAANRGQSLPARGQVLKASQSPGGDLVDVPVRGTPQRGPSSDDIANMDAQQMQGARRGGTSYGKMTDQELELEQVYLATQQGKDQQLAAIRETPAYAEYLSLKGAGAHEDARGIMEQMGITDPEDLKALTFSSGGADSRAAKRAARMAEVEAEMLRRRAQFGDAPPDAIPSSQDRTMPSRGAVTMPDRGAELPTLDAKTVQAWKFELDDKIAKLEGLEGGRVSQEREGLIQTRDEIEALLYEHANPGDDGANLWGKAQQTYAKPMQEREAFALGQSKGRSMQPVDAARMGQGPHAAFTRKGVANTIHEDLAKLQDGAAGQIRNPAPMVMGSDQVDARVAFALNDDAERIGRVQSTARNASRRLKNKNDILGGSQTAQRLADDAGQGLNPTDVLAAASNPLNAAMRAVGKGANALRRNVVGQDMDATARLLMAGAPGAMTREQAIAMLRRMEPAIRAQLERQLIARGAMGGVAGGAAAR